MTQDAPRTCPICATPTTPELLAEAGWVDQATENRLRAKRADWRRADGACPACVQEALLTLLIERGERVLGRAVQDVWPLDAEAAFGALPTPLRLRADPRFTGRGQTIAIVDAGFYPHADLTTPVNRIRAWAATGVDPIEVRLFGRGDRPRWPQWDAGAAWQWHGLMTGTAAAGNGARSRGLYRGIAPDAEVVLVQARTETGQIGSAGLTRALEWLYANREGLELSVVSISLGVGVEDLRENPVDAAVTRLVRAGVIVVAAAGNDGVRRLVPPATAPDAVTVGGLDDGNVIESARREVWHSNFGESSRGEAKPELVAPSIWVTAPILPDTDLAREAEDLFRRRAGGDATVEQRIGEARLVTPFYQHVEGTSFAAPIVAGVVACMLEANPSLTPDEVRQALCRASTPVEGASFERQGAGAIDAGRAVSHALALLPGRHGLTLSPRIDGHAVQFELLESRASSVRVVGSWDDWRQPLAAARLADGIWCTPVTRLDRGTYAYKFAIDDDLWLPDPANPLRGADGFGGWNSVLTIDP
jgi:serine protease AprX